MAIYHFSAQTISRSQGRSAVAASAYRAASRLLDERTGLTHDFTKKSDVINSEIMLPENAPEKFANRETLWNAVEMAEKRKDAQLTREINIALPRELGDAQNWELTCAFVKSEFVEKGMIADVSFHRGHTGNEEQPHVHIMLTMREVTEEGFGQKNRDWNSKELLGTWRERWAERCNLELARAGFDIKIDHRTLEAQGINLEPQAKIGPNAARDKMARLAEHQELAHRNGERLMREPEIALAALTRQQSTFTHHDIARFVLRHTDSREQFQEVYAKIKAHPELVLLGKDDRGRERFTTGELLELETKMMEQVRDKFLTSKHTVADNIQDAAIKNKSLSHEQRSACRHITGNRDIACVVGFAGTGKSYMLNAAREAWEEAGYKVQGMTLSGIAAQNLEAGSGIASTTVASREWYWQRDRERLTNKDIVVVDEAGMLGSRQMAGILDEAAKGGAKVVLVGDAEQLQAIEAGAAFRAIAERIGAVEMTEIRRQTEPWQIEATKDFALARTPDGIMAYENHDNVHTFNTKAQAITSMVEQWDEVRSQAPEKSQIMLAYTRAEVKELNEKARELCKQHGELGESYELETSRGMRKLAEGDRIYFLRNENRELKVKNGTLGTIDKIEGNNLSVKLDCVNNESSRTVEFNLQDYNEIDHGYAATVHKAQGITVDRTHVLASTYFDRHITYVAMSRHKEGADIYYSRDDFPTFNDMTKTLSRQRAKDVTLDYAEIRSFEVAEETLLTARHIEINKGYDTNITEERLKAAEARLAQRQYENALRHDLQDLSKKTGWEVSMEFNEGDRGIYRGRAEIVGRNYGILEHEGQAKLIPYQQLRSRQIGQEMTITKVKSQGREVLRGMQEPTRSLGMSRGLGIEIDFGGF